MDSKVKNEQENNSIETKTIANKCLLPIVGRVYSVKRIDGEWFSAEVLEKRELKGKPVEYFVHFENCKIPLKLLNLY